MWLMPRSVRLALVCGVCVCGVTPRADMQFRALAKIGGSCARSRARGRARDVGSGMSVDWRGSWLNPTSKLWSGRSGERTWEHWKKRRSFLLAPLVRSAASLATAGHVGALWISDSIAVRQAFSC